MFRKNRTHDQGWKLAAQRHLLQALEIFSGGMVRIENFDTVTKEHLKPTEFSFYDGRKFEVKAIVVGDNLGGAESPQNITATMTLGFSTAHDPDYWKLVAGSEGFADRPYFAFSMQRDPSTRISTYWAEFNYRDVREGKNVLPEVCVGPASRDPAERMLGRHLGDRRAVQRPAFL